MATEEDPSEEYSTNEASNIVIDNGSYMMHAGFSGDDFPIAVFPTCCSIRTPTSFFGTRRKSVYVADEAVAKRAILRMYSNVILNGQITQWYAINKLWHHTFDNELSVDPEQYNVLLSEPTMNLQTNREQTAQLMFETFNIKALYLEKQSVLSLYSSGRTDGIVVDCGYSSTRIDAVYNGHALKHTHFELDIGGREICSYLLKLSGILNSYTWSDDHCTHTSEVRRIIRDLIAKHAYIAEDYDIEMNSKNDKNDIEIEYELPDGNVLKLDTDRFKCAEILFRPLLIKDEVMNIGWDEYSIKGEYGIHELLIQSIEKCKDPNDDRELDLNLNTIVLCGGGSVIKGFKSRLEREMSDYGGIYNIVNTQPGESRTANKCATWIGGSILASLSSFDDCWMSKEEYEEYGSNIVNIHCF